MKDALVTSHSAMRKLANRVRKVIRLSRDGEEITSGDRKKLAHALKGVKASCNDGALAPRR